MTTTYTINDVTVENLLAAGRKPEDAANLCQMTWDAYDAGEITLDEVSIITNVLLELAYLG